MASDVSIIASTTSRSVEAIQLISTTVPVIINALDAGVQDHIEWTGKTSSQLMLCRASQDQVMFRKEGHRYTMHSG